MRSLFIAASMLLISGVSFAQNKSIKFINNSLDKAVEKAKESNKLIFVDAYTTWCGPCKWMSANMFTNPEIAEFYNENFVNLKLDMEKGEGKDFAEKYAIRAYPTLIFIDAEGVLQHRKVGASKEVKDYIELGTTANNREENLAGLSARYEKGEADPDFISKYLKVLQEAGQPNKDVLSKYYESLNPSDFENEEIFELIAANDKSTDSKAMQHILANREKFSSLYAEKVDDLLHDNFLQWTLEPIRSKESDRKEMEKRMIKVKKLNIPEWQKIILIVDLNELSKEKRMDEFVEIAVADVGEYFADEPYSLNSFAWTVFENTDNKEYLQEALKWANTALEQKMDYAILDTKANIQFKLGMKEEAIATQTKALEVGKENGMSDREVKSYTETLKKFKK